MKNFRFCIASSLALAVSISLSVLPRSGFGREGTGPIATTPSTLVSKLRALVLHHGWTADYGRACPMMRIGTEMQCRLKQLAVSLAPAGSLDDHGVNATAEDTPLGNDLLMFHLTPLIGHFFVVGIDGALKTAFYRTRGIDFTESPREVAHPAFEASLAFWRDQSAQLQEMLRTEKTPTLQ